MLRSAQTTKSMVDTDKILYELDQARQGDATTGQDIAEALGVDPGAYEAIAAGGATMPAMPGPQGPALPVQIPQAMRDKATNANTMKILQQLSGGTSSGATVDTMMAALLKGQDLGTMSNMQGGQQKPFDVATMKAAMEGKLPGRTGAGGGSVTAKVQQMDDLIGKGMSKTDALKWTYGDPASEAWNVAYTRAYQQTFSVASAIKSANATVEQAEVRNLGLDPFNEGPKKAAPPGKVVKVYK